MARTQLLQHFDTLAETPEAVAKLRALVFGLAIRGCLLAQHQSDEPASPLLERIRKQKGTAQNDSLRKAKQPRELPELVEPFALPESWEWTTLGFVSLRIHYGYTASAIHGETGVRLLRITDIQNGQDNWGTVPG
jgi:type I restriction enzyme S subunit